MNHARLALTYGSNMPIRVALALASSFWCVGLFVLAGTEDARFYRLMSGATPALWAAVFAANSAALWWRIFDRRPRPHFGRLINASTAALWLMVTIATMVDFGFLAGAGDMTLTIMAFWVVIRTDLTTTDRETA